MLFLIFFLVCKYFIFKEYSLIGITSLLIGLILLVIISFEKLKYNKQNLFNILLSIILPSYILLGKLSVFERINFILFLSYFSILSFVALISNFEYKKNIEHDLKS